MRFDVITLFAPMFDAVASHGISGRARERGLWQLRCWNPRDYATDAYRSVDDRPYGGGPGMVMLAEPLVAAIGAIAQAQAQDQAQAQAPAQGQARAQAPVVRAPVIHLSPRGAPLTHERIARIAGLPAVTLLASRYEAVDQRLIDRHVDEELSIGDFIVSGGELPAMMLIDAAVRLLPGAMNDARSVVDESFADGLLEGPHYTRPEEFEGLAVPPVLLSGHHARIARWRREQSLAATLARRPELIDRARAEGRLSPEDERCLAGLAAARAASHPGAN